VLLYWYIAIPYTRSHEVPLYALSRIVYMNYSPLLRVTIQISITLTILDDNIKEQVDYNIIVIVSICLI